MKRKVIAIIAVLSIAFTGCASAADDIPSGATSGVPDAANEAPDIGGEASDADSQASDDDGEASGADSQASEDGGEASDDDGEASDADSQASEDGNEASGVDSEASGVGGDPSAQEGAEEYYELAEKTIKERKLPDMSNVTAYGNFQGYTYYSNTAERDTPVNVLLPPDYSEDKEYPVLYILHGFFDNQDWMARDVVGIPQMLTELYEKGEAEEMIVVLPYIFTSKEMPSCTGMDLDNCLAYDNFINDLTTDLMPFIEETFSVKKGRENTAVTGFSMGGRESLFIGISRPDLFDYVGACCPAPGLVPIPNSPMHPGQLQNDEVKFSDENRPKLVFISAGGNDNVVGTSPADYHKLLEENGEQSIYELMAGTAHDHTSVKPHLYKYLSVIFK